MFSHVIPPDLRRWNPILVLRQAMIATSRFIIATMRLVFGSPLFMITSESIK